MVFFCRRFFGLLNNRGMLSRISIHNTQGFLALVASLVSLRSLPVSTLLCAVYAQAATW